MEHTNSADELRHFAAEFIARVAPRSGATVIALSGDLGAGKTTFSQGVAAALGVVEAVSSPTFVIEKIYDLSGQRWQRLIHIDAYRLAGASDLAVLRWGEITRDPGNLILLEWPERIEGALPAGALSLRFDIEGDGRIITSNDGRKNDQEDKEGGLTRS